MSISIESGKTLRKVCRIIEKRVCQDYWNQGKSGRDTAGHRYSMKHRLSNHLRNIYRFVPTGFRYVAQRYRTNQKFVYVTYICIVNQKP